MTRLERMNSYTNPVRRGRNQLSITGNPRARPGLNSAAVPCGVLSASSWPRQIEREPKHKAKKKSRIKKDNIENLKFKIFNKLFILLTSCCCALLRSQVPVRSCVVRSHNTTIALPPRDLGASAAFRVRYPLRSYLHTQRRARLCALCRTACATM